MSAPGNNKENGGGREKKWKEGRKREGEGKGRREKEGSGIQAQLNHLGCLLVGGVTTGSLLSAIWSATLYPPNKHIKKSS
jgi:hypothetical protein